MDDGPMAVESEGWRGAPRSGRKPDFSCTAVRPANRRLTGTPDAKTPGFHHRLARPDDAASLYSEMTGHPVLEGSDDDGACVTFGEVDLAFQPVEAYRPPDWPEDEHPKQAHRNPAAPEAEAAPRRRRPAPGTTPHPRSRRNSSAPASGGCGRTRAFGGTGGAAGAHSAPA
jgi:hypothetical protein